MQSSHTKDYSRTAPGGGLRSSLEMIREGWREVGLDDEAVSAADRLRDFNSPLLLFVVGEGNFGKSSLVNALCGAAVAQVSILPRTWKVDIYERSPSGRPASAHLQFEGERERRTMSLEEAEDIIEAEEKATHNARQAKKTGDSGFKSRLRDVRWFIPGIQLPADVALVDTPGFSQVRRDIELRDISLRTAQGVHIEAKEPFEYWYHRADVVLWALKATKLNDRDTMHALETLKLQKKPTVAALTHMDRVPKEQWDEVLDKAKSLFGQYVSAIVPVIAKPKVAGHDETIAHLREVLEYEYFEQARQLKEDAQMRFVEHSCSRLVQFAESLRQLYTRNSDILKNTLNAVRGSLGNVRGEIRSELQEWTTQSKTRATKRIATAYGRIPKSDAEFQSMCNAALEGHIAIPALRDITAKALKQGTSVIIRQSSKLEFVGVRLGRDGTDVFVSTPDLAKLQDVLVEAGNADVRIRDAISGWEGIGEGAVLGAIGAAVLGPVGWLLAGVGLFFADDIKRNKLREHTTGIAQSWFIERAQETGKAVDRVFDEGYDKVKVACNDAFSDFCGIAPEAAEERATILYEKIIKPLAQIGPLHQSEQSVIEGRSRSKMHGASRSRPIHSTPTVAVDADSAREWVILSCLECGQGLRFPKPTFGQTLTVKCPCGYSFDFMDGKPIHRLEDSERGVSNGAMPRNGQWVSVACPSCEHQVRFPRVCKIKTVTCQCGAAWETYDGGRYDARDASTFAPDGELNS